MEPGRSEPHPDNPASATPSAASATIARVLAQIGVRPLSIDFEPGEGGDIVARIVIEQGVSELLCTLNGEGDLIAARLLEL